MLVSEQKATTEVAGVYGKIDFVSNGDILYEIYFSAKQLLIAIFSLLKTTCAYIYLYTYSEFSTALRAISPIINFEREP